MFLSLTADYSDAYRNQTLRKAIVYMTLILTLFFIAGTYIMNFFGISLEGMRIAGGMMIMQAAFGMLSPNQQGRKLSEADVDAAKSKADVSFSPLAMPLLSGPGSIAVVLGFSASVSGISNYIYIIAAIFLTSVTAYIILRISPKFVLLLGRSGLVAMTRLMGFIVLSIGVQFIINGIIPLIKSLL